MKQLGSHRVTLMKFHIFELLLFVDTFHFWLNSDTNTRNILHMKAHVHLWQGLAIITQSTRNEAEPERPKKQ
jgi:hypothetical protein